jgi:hypothetical protein
MDKRVLIELNRLWEPVRLYLAQQVGDLYGRNDGNVIEIGPFSGLLFDLARSNIGSSFCMALFPEAIIDSLQEDAQRLGLQDKIAIRTTDERLSGIPPETFDLAIFRGAFFFPSLFRPDLPAVYRVLRAGGIALVGGGYGIHTPLDMVERIGKRSAELNQQLGRVHLAKEDLQTMLQSAHLEQNAEIIGEGGLWVVLRK